MISSDLIWTHHVKYCANKANKILGMLTRTFEYRDLDIIKSLYTTFVRPHLEFAVAVWNPYLKGDIEILEKVQRRATKLVLNLKNLAYEDRLVAMNLTTLETRRERGDLIQLYKLIHGFDCVNWPSCINLTPPTFELIQSRRHKMQLQRELVRNCVPRHNYFTNRVVNNWNKLPGQIVYAPTVNSIKAQIDDWAIFR
jgi:ribonuclease P/MRP protein subunit RPP40